MKPHIRGVACFFLQYPIHILLTARYMSQVPKSHLVYTHGTPVLPRGMSAHPLYLQYVRWSTVYWLGFLRWAHREKDVLYSPSSRPTHLQWFFKGTPVKPHLRFVAAGANISAGPFPFARQGKIVQSYHYSYFIFGTWFYTFLHSNMFIRPGQVGNTKIITRIYKYHDSCTNLVFCVKQNLHSPSEQHPGIWADNGTWQKVYKRVIYISLLCFSRCCNSGYYNFHVVCKLAIKEI